MNATSRDAVDVLIYMVGLGIHVHNLQTSPASVDAQSRHHSYLAKSLLILMIIVSNEEVGSITPCLNFINC
jgi:hypothetical protein